MNKRNLNLDKYGISGHRYKELCGFCEQYPDWKKELEGKQVLKSQVLDDMPKSKNNYDSTCENAVRRVDTEMKCTIVEEACKEASGDLWQYMIDNVCYGVPVRYLIMKNGLPLSTNSFYDLRRYFFYILDKKKKM